GVRRHRLVPTYEAPADGKTPDDLILEVMRHVRAPYKPLETHVRAAAQSLADPAPARVDGHPPPGRSAARRLPHIVSRLWARSRRSARVSVPRRCAAHRLERDRAVGDTLCP